MLTDTHCHILSTDYDNVKEILENLVEYNIKRIIINGCNHKTNQEVIELVNSYDNVYGALGIHPDEVQNITLEAINFIKDKIKHPKILAIGEIGLDYHWNKDNKEVQIKNFTNMLEIAKENNKPVIIHSREAYIDMIEILSKYKLKGIIHCFSGSFKEAEEYIKLGYKLGINGIITFKKSNLAEIIKKIDISNILLETDSPYITPEPYRKYKNEPKYINIISKKIADTYDIDEVNLSKILEQNLIDVFDF